MMPPSPPLLRVAPELATLHILAQACATADNALAANHSLHGQARPLDPSTALARSMMPLMSSLTRIIEEYTAIINDRVYPYPPGNAEAPD